MKYAFLGKVYENLMVDLRPTNDKLIDRACRILGELARLDPEPARALLEQSGMDLKVALVMALGELGREDARQRLEAVGGHVAEAIRLAKQS